MSVTVIAHSNIALVKYWGKRDEALNLPAAGSVSLTLGGLDTTTTVSFDPALPHDHVSLNNTTLTDGPKLRKITRFIDRVRALAHIDTRAHVTSANAFPATILITDRRPVINSNRDFDCAFNFISGRSSAVALLARVLDDLARTLAVWTGGCGANLPDERILDPGNLTRSFASSASFWLSSTFDACTCTRKTSF